MKKPNFEKLVPLFESNEEFSITEKQYKQSTGTDLPKEIYYLKNKSAISKEAKKYGYEISVKEKTICFQRKIS